MEEVKLNLYQKINLVKSIVKNFTKDAKTEGYGAYTYTSGTQILSAIKEKMEELQLLLLPISTEHQHHELYNYTTKNGQKTDFVVMGKIIYEWINAENPEERQRVEWQYYGQQGDISKAFGSGLTYSERYILLKSLGVPTDEEDPDSKNEDKPQKQNTGSKTETKYNLVLKKCKENGYTLDQVNVWIKKSFKKEIKINDLTDEQFNKLMTALDNKKDSDNE